MGNPELAGPGSTGGSAAVAAGDPQQRIASNQRAFLLAAPRPRPVVPRTAQGLREVCYPSIVLIIATPRLVRRRHARLSLPPEFPQSCQLSSASYNADLKDLANGWEIAGKFPFRLSPLF
jgi:hypothetical protein